MAEKLNLIPTIEKSLGVLGYTNVNGTGTWRSPDGRTGYVVSDSAITEYNLSMSKPVKAATFAPMAFLDELARMLAEHSAQSPSAEESVPDFGMADAQAKPASKPLSEREASLKSDSTTIAQNAKLFSLYTGQPSHWLRTSSESMILWSIEPDGSYGHGKSIRKIKFAADTPRVRFESLDLSEQDKPKYNTRNGGKTFEGRQCLEILDWLGTSDGAAFGPIPNMARATKPAQQHVHKPEHELQDKPAPRMGTVPAAMQNGPVVSKPAMAGESEQPAMQARVISLLREVAQDSYAIGTRIMLGAVPCTIKSPAYVCDGKLFVVKADTVEVRLPSGVRDEYTINAVVTLSFADFLTVQCAAGMWASENTDSTPEPEMIEL